MRFRFFTIPAFDPDAAQDALNAFCAQHRIVASDRHFVDRGVNSLWAVCVTWVEGAGRIGAEGEKACRACGGRTGLLPRRRADGLGEVA